jgi:rhodanese-related sulfurtransferase
MSKLWWLPFGKVSEIAAGDLRARLDRREPVQLIDVRTPGEFASGHIHGAINVPINQLRSALPALKIDRNQPVIAICQTAHRSPPAVRLLQQAGFSTQQLRGGMIAWNRAKFLTTKK